MSVNSVCLCDSIMNIYATEFVCTCVFTLTLLNNTLLAEPESLRGDQGGSLHMILIL